MASLKLSMEKWRNGGCFEKYWVRNPVKKAHRDFQNPPGTSMIRLGSAMMIVEPHTFEVILHAVKSSTGTAPLSAPKASNSFNQVIPPYKPPIRSASTFSPASKVSKDQVLNAPTATASTHANLTPKPEAQNPAPATSIKGGKVVPAVASPRNAYTKSAPGINKNGKSALQPSPTDPSGNNPVIRELAHRASHDSILKDLMKIVAQGGASEMQVKEFQRYIDDINVMLREKSASMPTTKQRSTTKASQSSNSSRQTQPMTWTPPITSNMQQESGMHSQSSSIPKSTTSRPEVSAVIFEILTGSGDRYIVPRKSLLEFREGNRLAVLSFLVHLKGECAHGGFYQNQGEYCELITFKFLSDRPSVLEPLRRAVDSPESVRKHMQEWAEKMTLAEKAHLMLRLRMAPETEESRPQIAVSVIKEEIPKPEHYEAPNSLFPLHRNLVAGRS